MTQALPFLFSLIPFAVFVYLLIFKKLSLIKTSLITLALTTVLVILYWQILPRYIFVSYIKGFFVALDIFFIIAGAIFFLEILKKFGVIESVSYYLESFSKDFRIQVILLAWFLENFIEGTAGFGTPSAIVAPLLVGLGIEPLTAAVLSLFGNSSSVVFGAAGAPIRIGFAGLNVSQVPYYAALINIIGMIVPLFMLWTVVKDHQNKKQLFWEAVPFALWSGFIFVVSSFLLVPFGQEFPSIIGAVVGVILVFVTIRLGIFVPKNIYRTRSVVNLKPKLSLLKTVLPYFLLITFLILGKLFLSGVFLKMPFGVNHSVNLFNPGFAFIVAGLIIAVWWLWALRRIQKQPKNFILKSFGFSFKQAAGPFLVIIAMSSMVQLMINSGNNYSGLESLINIIARVFETEFLPFLAPLAGAFGSFLTGSATISNLLFGGFLAQAASGLSMPQSIILALILVGGAAGNMIALADMLAAETVVGLKHREREILGRIFLPCLIYVVFAGILGFMAVRLF